MVIIKDKRGNVITYASTVQEGRLLIRQFEADDVAERCYQPNYYELFVCTDD